MTTYQWCGLVFRSDLDIPELLPAEDVSASEPDWLVRTGEAPPPRVAHHWFHHWRFPDGRRWLSFARRADGYLLRFPRLADFDVRMDERAIVCRPLPSTPPDTFRHLLLDQVFPLIAGSADRLALHGSVAADASGAIAFLGQAGRGKSTLAAAFGRSGFSVLSDDCCVLRRRAGAFEAVPSYPGSRLSPESIAHLFEGSVPPLERVAHYSAKRRVHAPQDGAPFNSRPISLRRLYVLAPPTSGRAANGIDIHRRHDRTALLDVLGSVFYLDVECAPALNAAFQLAADAVERHGVRRLAYPRDLSVLDRVVEAVVDDLSR